MWWHMPVILVPWSWRQRDQEFKLILGCTDSLSQVWATCKINRKGEKGRWEIDTSMFQTIVVSVWSPGRLSYSSDVFQIHLHTMSGRYNINCNSVWGINMQRCLALGLCPFLDSGHRQERVWLFVWELCVGHSSFDSGAGSPLWLLQTPLSFSSSQESL